jgi:predicted GNAT family acetyltransferase
MRLAAHADAEAFLAAADALLAADEPRHNLIYGICSTLIETPTAYPESYFWTVEDHGAVVAALVLTPPYNVAVARPLRDDALVFAAERLRVDGLGPPGVTGAVPEADRFARAWTDAPRLRMAQGIYAAREIRVPDLVSGEMRLATLEDLEHVVLWVREFQAEVLPEEALRIDVQAGVERRLRSATAGTALWEEDGHVVSMCGFGGRTPHGVRIGPVYTPPELRGRGYGSAVTASASKRLLDGDRDFCFLYTDLSNPTSNKIYMNIGYEYVCDSADYAFD